LNLIDYLKEPESFEDAYYHPNFEEKDEMERSNFERI
jgi:hypothetical protein